MSNNTSDNVLKIRPTEGGLYEVYWPGGGELPGSRSGRYTFADEAQKAIDVHYLIINDKLKATRQRALSKSKVATTDAS